MTSTTIAQSTATVHEYSLTVFNPEDNDTQKLTAAFTNLPTLEDWQQWLHGWTDTGYELLSQPQLLHIL